MSIQTSRSITCRTLLVPVVSAFLCLGLLADCLTRPSYADTLYASNVDILIIDTGTNYIDDSDAASPDGYTNYEDYDREYSPYDLYGEDPNQYWESPAGNVFDIIEQNLMLDNPNDEDAGIYFQDGFQTI